MWLKNKGFYMAELLLSLSAWMVATGVLLPLVLFLTEQSIQARQEADASYLLYDRLQQIKINPDSITADTIERSGTIFEVTTSHSDSDVEVCVQFEGYVKKDSIQCAFAE